MGTGGGEGSNSRVEGAARRCGLELTKKQVRVSFDTFMAKSRPGLESDEEEKESPKPKRKTNKKNNNVKEEDSRDCEVVREEGEEGEERKADQDGGVEQSRLEDGSAPAQSSSSKGILVYCVPYVFYQYQLYNIYNAINYRCA